jgi:hypothetical protein
MILLVAGHSCTQGRDSLIIENTSETALGAEHGESVLYCVGHRGGKAKALIEFSRIIKGIGKALVVCTYSAAWMKLVCRR